MAASHSADYFSDQVQRSRRFYFRDWQQRGALTGQLDVVGGGCEWCQPDFQVCRQGLPFLAFEFVARGQGTVRLNGVEHALGPGHAFFYDTKTPHEIRTDPAAPMVKYFFNYVGKHAQQLHDHLALPTGTVIRLLDTTRILTLLDEVIDHSLRGSPLGLRCASASLEYALSLCADGRHSPQTKPDPAYATFVKCRETLLRHYPQLSTVEQAAKLCHVSAAYFTRLFQRYDTETPLACLTRLKMTHARLLINEPQAQVKAVAAVLGYKSSAHFSRVFKKWHGESPALIR
jgi:AraC family transcriptional regulator, arabinose operon regulatory protein